MSTNYTLILVKCDGCKVLFFEKPEICPVCSAKPDSAAPRSGFTELHIETPRVEERAIAPVNHGYVVARDQAKR